jgi:Family of unknown function (DUF5519)
VPIAFRADLQPFLVDFIEHHRGLRQGRMFGLPAGYAGRKMFVCLIEDGLIVKLPTPLAREELRRGHATPFTRRGRPSKAWIKYVPRTARDVHRLAPLLELAARHVAETA